MLTTTSTVGDIFDGRRSNVGYGGQERLPLFPLEEGGLRSIVTLNRVLFGMQFDGSALPDKC